MESESGDFEPDQSQDGQRARGEVTPVWWRENAVLEVRSEKMKVRDEKNRQPFCDVDPKEAFHRMGLTGMGCNGQAAPSLLPPICWDPTDGYCV